MQNPPVLRSIVRVLGTVAALLLASASAQTAPPATFTRTVSTSTDSVTVNFTLHPVRSTNFKVLVQQSDGSFSEVTTDVPRTYLGTVDGYPGAVAAALVRANGTVYTRVSFENGMEWYSYGGTASIRGSTNWTPAWPTSVVGTGGAGSTVRGAEVGVDASYRQVPRLRLRSGGDTGHDRVLPDLHRLRLSARCGDPDEAGPRADPRRSSPRSV
ncbi:MAG: hypothetical protein QM755_01140 [Luteolibacter sp.]